MKKAFNRIALSAIILAAGFFSMSLPFHLFTELTSGQMRALWIFEIVVYFFIVGICLSAAEKHAEKKKAALKEKQKAKKNAAPQRGQDCDAAA